MLLSRGNLTISRRSSCWVLGIYCGRRNWRRFVGRRKKGSVSWRLWFSRVMRQERLVLCSIWIRMLFWLMAWPSHHLQNLNPQCLNSSDTICLTTSTPLLSYRTRAASTNSMAKSSLALISSNHKNSLRTLHKRTTCSYPTIPSITITKLTYSVKRR